MVWLVYAPTSRRAGALSGTYGGASAEATVGAGVGANVLVGGSQSHRRVAAALGAGPDRVERRCRRGRHRTAMGASTRHVLSHPRLGCSIAGAPDGSFVMKRTFLIIPALAAAVLMATVPSGAQAQCRGRSPRLPQRRRRSVTLSARRLTSTACSTVRRRAGASLLRDVQRLGVDLGYTPACRTGLVGVRAHGLDPSGRPSGQLRRRPGQCDGRCRGRRQCAGRRLHQHLRAAAVQCGRARAASMFRRHRPG